MFSFNRSENANQLHAHNIRIRELNPSSSRMSQPPRQVIHLPKVRMLSRGGRGSSGVRITNVKSIRPPDPEAAKKQEEDRLRAQLQQEIVQRSRTCAYKSYECPLPVLTGRQYCYRHILRDPTAPYRQCAHTYGNGERCQLPAPDEQRDPRDPGLCFEHARAALQARQRSAAPPPPAPSTEALLNQLQHYVKPERPRTTSCASSVSVVSDPSEQEQQGSPQAVDPFRQIDATAINAAYSSSIMEWCSDSDSDGDSVSLGRGGDCRHHEQLSDAEDAPVEEQTLWHAGVFTAEEAVSEAKNVLKLLQSAYLRQMDRLKVWLQTARLQYLRQLAAEKEHHCSINTQARAGNLSARERRQLKKLKALASYHRKHGVDAVLARKLHHKRSKKYDGCTPRPVPAQARCTFSEGGVRCAAHVLPAAKHCLKHILQDRHQVLFAACGDSRGVPSCREPVAKLPLPPTCRYHTDPPESYIEFTLKGKNKGKKKVSFDPNVKDGSDSESETHSTSDAESHHTELTVTEEIPTEVPADKCGDLPSDLEQVLMTRDDSYE